MSKNYYRQKMFRKLKQLKINIGDKCINNIEKNGRKENNNEINIDNTNNVNVIIYQITMKKPFITDDSEHSELFLFDNVKQK